MTAVVAAAFLALVACTETPAADAQGTEGTTQDLLTAAGAVDAPTGSLPPGAPRRLGNQPPPQEVDLAILGVNRGSADAPVRVVEFSDFGCGYCRKFHQETFPVLREKFIDAGKVEWKFLPYVSGMFKNSPATLGAAECVLEQGTDLFEEMNERVWDGQKEWKSASDPAPIVREMAAASGADMADFDACMAEGRRGWRVDAATQLARQLGVRATPTFFVVGYPPLQGALPTEMFEQVLAMAYQEATKEGGDR